MVEKQAIWRLFRIELRLFRREPAAVFFSLFFPALLALVIDAAFGHEKAIGSFRVSDVNVPAVLAITLANIGLVSVPIVVADYKERCILKRYRTSPISIGWLLFVLVGVSFIMFTAGAILLIIATKIFFGLHFAGNPLVLGLLATLAAVTFSALGVMIGGLLGSARSAQALGSLLFFPAMFLSGAVFPVSSFPVGLRMLSHALPLTYLVEGLSYLWVGQSSPRVWQAFLAMLAMGAISVVAAYRTFRWTSGQPL